MLSKSQLKLITSLAKKKYRIHHQLFIVEGVKSIHEFLKSDLQLSHLFSTNQNIFNLEKSKFSEITESELKRISFLSKPNTALAIFKMPKPKSINQNQLIVALDNVNDPGNLGTIIRLCDWFGVKDLICNTETVDCYNPKVVQASMGSLARVNITYLNLKEFLKDSKNMPVYGTFMEGDNVYKSNLDKKGIVIFGNEANGINDKLESLISKKLSIPRFGLTQETESLNVAAAAAILLSEFKRRTIEK